MSTHYHPSDLKTDGLRLSRKYTPDQLLTVCFHALQDWNIHDIAASCMDRAAEVPEWLRSKPQEPTHDR
jgi:hypothetical protein